MTIYKKAICSSEVVSSSTVYVCNSCGHTEMTKDNEAKNRECPKCKSVMSAISSESKPEEPKE